MIILNLLPAEKKKDVKFRKVYYTIRKIVILILLYTSSISILLLLGKFALQNNFNKVMDELSLIAIANEPIAKDIKNLNKVFTSMDKIQKNHSSPQNVLANIIQSAVDGIEFSALSQYSATKSINIQGKAKNREKLLAFKNNLENSQIFTIENFPYSNIFQEKNITFTIDIKVNKKIDPSSILFPTDFLLATSTDILNSTTTPDNNDTSTGTDANMNPDESGE